MTHEPNQNSGNNLQPVHRQKETSAVSNLPGISRQIALPHARNLSIQEESGLLNIQNPEGKVELQIRITEQGPVLVFNQARLSLVNSGDVDIQCQNLSIQTRGRMNMMSGAGFEHKVAGSYDVKVRDDATIRAQSIEVDAELGELALKANDDVALNGLRVLMNVPTDEEIQERAKNLKTFADYLNMPFSSQDGPRRMPKSTPVERELE